MEKVSSLKGDGLLKFFRGSGLNRLSDEFPSDVGIKFMYKHVLHSGNRLKGLGHLGRFSKCRSLKKMREALLALADGSIPVPPLSSDEEDGEDEIEEIGDREGLKSKRELEEVDSEVHGPVGESVGSGKQGDVIERVGNLEKGIAKVVEKIGLMWSLQQRHSEKATPTKNSTEKGGHYKTAAADSLGRIGEVIRERGAIKRSREESFSSSSNTTSLKKPKLEKTFALAPIKKQKLVDAELRSRGLAVGFEGLTSAIPTEDRIAASNLQHRVRGFGNITRSITERSWEEPGGREARRNKKEALSLARGLDLDISTLGMEATASLPSSEVRVRRLVALEQATMDGNWELARMLEENFQGYDPETNRALKEVIKLKKSMDKSFDKSKTKPSPKPFDKAKKKENKD